MESKRPDPALELTRAPFIRLLLPLLAGILCKHFVPLHDSFVLILPVALVMGTASVFGFQKVFKRFPGNYLFGVLVFVLLFATGIALCILKDQKQQSDLLCSSPGRGNTFYALHLVSSCVEKEKICKAIAELDLSGRPGSWKQQQGKVLVQFGKSKGTLTLGDGDRLLLYGRVQEIGSPPNPGMFDYRRYLANRNIFLQIRVDSSRWKPLAGTGMPWFLHVCAAGRMQMLMLLRKHHIGGDELGVGAALLLGYEDKLSADILQAYSGSGVMHVLSVSGLHVAILFAVLNACLGFTKRLRFGSFLKALILLSFLGLYATLTGLSAAVLRSSGMFCFVIMGQAFRRSSSIFNTLSASAFLLLIINPMLLFDAGFQLSYLAVLGIVVLQPSLQHLWEAPFWLGRQVFTMICVSVAAQLFTLPLSLYYFHQFPNYFLITNLVVIPLSTLVIYAGLGFFLLQSVPLLGPFTAKIFMFLLKVLNESVMFFGNLPGACWKGIWLSFSETLLLCLVLVMAVCYCIRRKHRWLFLCLYAGVLLTAAVCIRAWRQDRQKYILVYSVPRASVIDFVNGRFVCSVMDSSAATKPGLIPYLIEPCRDERGISHECRGSMSEGLVSYFFLNKHCLVVRGRVEHLPVVPVADYLIISKGAFCRDYELRALRFRQLVIDASCSRRETGYWKNKARQRNLPVWVVAEQGAFVEEI